MSSDAADFSPLGAAASAVPARVDEIEKLLSTRGERSCDVNHGGSCGWSPLSLALLGGDPNLGAVRMLIEHNADLEACPSTRPAQTPLLLATMTRQLACTEALIEAGARLNAIGLDGKSALMHCAAWSPDERAVAMCNLLIERRAEVRQHTPDGKLAAVESAIEAGNSRVVETPLSLGRLLRVFV